MVEETGELLVQFGATLPATHTRIIALGAEVEPLNIGRAALYWPQLLSRGWGTTLRRIHRASRGYPTFEGIAVEMSAHQLLRQPMPSCQQLTNLFGITSLHALELIDEIVRCGLDVVPENYPSNLCPDLGACGPLRRALAARLLDARANFREWQNRLTSFDARLPEMELTDREFEGVTNVGQALIASQLLWLPTSPSDLSAMIKGAVVGVRGYSRRNVGRWLPTAKDIVAGEAVGTPE